MSATYLGSYSDRLWAQTALNTGVFLGLGPCTLNTSTGPRSFPVCSTTANLNQRRVMSLQNPIKSAKIGALDLNSDVGWQKYRGLKLTARHRSASGVSLNGTYTLAKCEGTATPDTFSQTSQGYSDPNNPEFDAGPCDQDRTHLGTLSAGYQTPDVGNRVCTRLRRTGGCRASLPPARGARSISRVAATTHSPAAIPRYSGPTWSAMTSTVRGKMPPT